MKWIGSPECGFLVDLDLLASDSIVYSFGVGENISFDEELIQHKFCPVYAFDPTPKSKLFIEKRNLPENLFFFDYGLYNHDGYIKFYLPENPKYVSGAAFNRWGYDEQIQKPIDIPVKRLSTIMQELGHDKIDLLKMDIEGSEYCVLKDILDAEIPIKQILVEFHHRFPGIGIKATKTIIDRLNRAGYAIAGISKSKEEYTFIRKDK